MLNLEIPKEKIIDAALHLAAEEGWSRLALDKIATKADVNLSALRKEFHSKPQILAAFSRMLDDAVMTKVEVEPDISTRERLFDVLMTRFELMAPYKEGSLRIYNDLHRHPTQGMAQLCVQARSQYWMLTAAGIAADGPASLLRVPGLMGIYTNVFDTWLHDDDPRLAKTMAVLDQYMEKAEKIMQRLGNIRGAVERLKCAVAPSRCKPKKASEQKQPSPQEEVPPTQPESV
jgi:AcrR family transcriptional regulator